MCVFGPVCVALTPPGLKISGETHPLCISRHWGSIVFSLRFSHSYLYLYSLTKTHLLLQFHPSHLTRSHHRVFFVSVFLAVVCSKTSYIICLCLFLLWCVFLFRWTHCLSLHVECAKALYSIMETASCQDDFIMSPSVLCLSASSQLFHAVLHHCRSFRWHYVKQSLRVECLMI